MIQLQAGQSAKIMDVDPGTTFKVQEIYVPAGFLTPTYQCAAGTESSNQPCTVMTDKDNNPNPAITVTNTLETYPVPLDVRKNLIGRDWEDSDSFTFLLKPIGENAVKAPGPSGNQVQEAEDEWLLTVKASDVPLGDDVRMHEFWFDVPFSEEPYTYTIHEVKPEDSELGMTYSEVVWKLTLYANTDAGYHFELSGLMDGSDGGSGERSETRAQIRPVEFTNTYVAPVSSLPLTGGRSTARTLLLAGGGVLLVAGAAWLLARRRRV